MPKTLATGLVHLSGVCDWGRWGIYALKGDRNPEGIFHRLKIGANNRKFKIKKM